MQPSENQYYIDTLQGMKGEDDAANTISINRVRNSIERNMDQFQPEKDMMFETQ